MLAVKLSKVGIALHMDALLLESDAFAICRIMWYLSGSTAPSAGKLQ